MVLLAKGLCQGRAEVDRKQRKVDSIRDSSFFDVHEILESPELFGVAKIEPIEPIGFFACFAVYNVVVIYEVLAGWFQKLQANKQPINGLPGQFTRIEPLDCAVTSAFFRSARKTQHGHPSARNQHPENVKVLKSQSWASRVILGCEKHNFTRFALFH